VGPVGGGAKGSRCFSRIPVRKDGRQLHYIKNGDVITTYKTCLKEKENNYIIAACEDYDIQARNSRGTVHTAQQKVQNLHDTSPPLSAQAAGSLFRPTSGCRCGRRSRSTLFAGRPFEGLRKVPRGLELKQLRVPYSSKRCKHNKVDIWLVPEVPSRDNACMICADL
jgi:hypothetical protein